ncbi:MAG: hypothetical protein AAF213_09900 [Pseudomonadota bacterium]
MVEASTAKGSVTGELGPGASNLGAPNPGTRWAGLVLGFAMVAAATLCLIISLLLPVGLMIRSDVIGFPTYYDFDSRHYLSIKLIWLIGWPSLTALAFWLGHRYLAPIGGDWWRQPLWTEPVQTTPSPSTIWVMTALMLATLLAPWLLFGLSSATAVTIADTGEVIAYPWFPFLLAGVASLAAGVIIRKTPDALPSLAIMYIGAALLWPVFGGLPGALGPMDYFHEGEMLVPGAGLLDGQLPWRDLQMIHGPFFDAVRGALGQALFEPSRWGAVAGIHAVLNPLYFITWFWFFAWLARGQVLPAFLATLVVASLDPFVHVRLLLLAPLLLATGWYLTAPSIKRALLMVTIGVLLAIGTPEAVFAPLAVAIVVFAHDVLQPRPRHFAALKPAIMAGVIVGGVALGLLGLLGMLPGMWHHLMEFPRDHDLAGAIPLGRDSRIAMIAGLGAGVLAVIIAASISQIWRLWLARVGGYTLDPRVWVLLVASLFAALYFQKLVNRLDGHVFHVIAGTAPLIGWAVITLTRSLHHRLPPMIARWQPITLLLLVIVALTGPAWIKDQRAHMKARWAAPAPDLVPWRVLSQWQPQVARAPVHEKLGYATAEAEQETALQTWPQLIADYDLADHPVLDMTNRPGLFHYLLGLQPASDFFYISMALRRSSMAQIIDDLGDDITAIMPRARGWDGIPDTVRHYNVTAAVLGRAQPVADAPASVLYRTGTGQPAPSLAAGVVACDWGFAPAYQAPPDGADWQALDITRRQEAEAIRLAGWSLDPTVMQPAIQIRLFRNGEFFANIDVGEDRPDIVTAFGNNPGVLPSGFDRVLTLPPGWVDDLTAQAVMPDGRLVTFNKTHSAYGGFDIFDVVGGGQDVASWDHGNNDETLGGWLRITGTPAGQALTLAPVARSGEWKPAPITVQKPAHHSADRPLYLRLDACPGFIGRRIGLAATDRGDLGDVALAVSR